MLSLVSESNKEHLSKIKNLTKERDCLRKEMNSMSTQKNKLERDLTKKRENSVNRQ